jgi:hypothetical protein
MGGAPINSNFGLDIINKILGNMFSAMTDIKKFFLENILFSLN